jgi:hypothetical protein
MASRYVVRAVFNGTNLSIPVSARNPQVAAAKAAVNRLTRKASAYLVFERRTMLLVHSEPRRGN